MPKDILYVITRYKSSKKDLLENQTMKITVKPANLMGVKSAFEYKIVDEAFYVETVL